MTVPSHPRLLCKGAYHARGGGGGYNVAHAHNHTHHKESTADPLQKVFNLKQKIQASAHFSSGRPYVIFVIYQSHHLKETNVEAVLRRPLPLTMPSRGPPSPSDCPQAGHTTLTTPTWLPLPNTPDAFAAGPNTGPNAPQASVWFHGRLRTHPKWGRIHSTQFPGGSCLSRSITTPTCRPQKVRCGPATVLQPRLPSHGLHCLLSSLRVPTLPGGGGGKGGHPGAVLNPDTPETFWPLEGRRRKNHDPTIVSRMAKTAKNTPVLAGIPLAPPRRRCLGTITTKRHFPRPLFTHPTRTRAVSLASRGQVGHHTLVCAQPYSCQSHSGITTLVDLVGLLMQ